MTNFSVIFTNAWWLLLLIPAFALTLISYFKLNKRYRFTRNRIVSIAMHLVVMVLSILLLAGMTMEYYKPNTEVEVLLLVDYSYSLDDSEGEVDDFIKDVVDSCNSQYQLGVVKFGYDQVYAVELTNDMTKVYSGYLASSEPDTTATDIASALTYAESLFKNPESARVVLISDALETDSEAKNVIKSLSANGISVDTVYFPGEKTEPEVQIIGAEASVSKVEINSAFEMLLTINSTIAGPATITPYDNNIAGEPVSIDLVAETQTVSIPYTFAWGGMHVMTFELATEEDTIEQNNNYTSYVYLETFSEVLIIESITNESAMLSSVMRDELNATVVNITDEENLPTTLEELREFDEVILLNVSNEQLQKYEGFDLALQEYVQVIGGGLFTICGNTADSTDAKWTANAYTRKDMFGSVYQSMLPVEIVNYTPPAGVIIIVDASGSMLNGGKYEGSKLNAAMDGAKACLDALSERDYVGIMTLSDAYTEELVLTPRTQRNKILAAIAGLEHDATTGQLDVGGTVFSSALERAGRALASRSDLEKKHIIIVTDGEPTSTDREDYLAEARQIAQYGITMSIYGINSSSSAEGTMKELLKTAGNDEARFHNFTSTDYSGIPGMMRDDLNTPMIEDVNYETFTPTINATGSVTNNLDLENHPMPTLDGYYGVKKKPDATAYLMGKYTPIYTQWDYGKGRVGTFACDLNGTWSADFLASETGKAILNNIIYALFPTESVRTSDIDATYTGDNYTTNLSIFTELGEGESIKVTVLAQDGTEEVYLPGASYSRMSFPIKSVGLNTIIIQKLDVNGVEISSKTLYKALSYSAEYDAFSDTVAAEELMSSLSEDTNGVVVKDPIEIFENAVEYLHIVIDPRILFAIIIIVCFLIDIAVRKFKWKWPHEIIREKKLKAKTSK